MENSYCKIGQPIMSANKAGEIYYKRADILDKGIYMINKISNNKYMFSHVDDFKNGKVNATARPCIFLGEDGECMLGGEKPETCDGASIIKPLLLKDMLKIGFKKNELKKRLGRMKEDMILYLTIWHLNRLLDKEEGDTLGDVFKIDYTYKLVLVDNKTINSIRYTKLTALDPKYEVVAKIYNSISRTMLVLPPDYVTLFVTKLNKFIKAGNFSNCESELDDVRKSSVYLLSMFRLYVNNYNQKSNDFKGIVESTKTYNFLKDINNELGGNEDGSLFKREKIECILNNNEQMFKIIMKNK